MKVITTSTPEEKSSVKDLCPVRICIEFKGRIKDYNQGPFGILQEKRVLSLKQLSKHCSRNPQDTHLQFWSGFPLSSLYCCNQQRYEQTV